jgi:hypothetical protein
MSGKRKNEESDGSDTGAEEGKQKTPPKRAKKVGKDAVFELGGMKKVTVSQYKGKLLVNIREFYEDRNTGEEKVTSCEYELYVFHL